MSWFESQNKEIIDRGKARKVAERHYDVANKSGSANTVLTPPITEPHKEPDTEKEDTVTITFEKDIEHDKAFHKLLGEFENEQNNPEDLEYSLEGKSLEIPAKYVKEFKTSLVKKGINVSDDNDPK